MSFFWGGGITGVFPPPTSSLHSVSKDKTDQLHIIYMVPNNV